MAAEASANEAGGRPTRGVASLVSIALILCLVRTGAIAGMWPVLTGADGFVEENLLPYLLHLLGAAATAVAVAARHRPTMLIGAAFTGYSTVTLGLGATDITLATLLWAVGLAALAALILTLLRVRPRSGGSGGAGPVRGGAWLIAAAVGLMAAVAVSLISVAG